MTRRFYLVAFVGAGLGLTALAAEPAAFATSMTRTLHLHGGMYAPKAMATARITQTAPADYRVQIIAEGLPAADMLHATPRRHAYIAWAIYGMDKNAMPGVLPLTLNKTTRAYTVNRVVMLKHVTRVFVTADKSAMQHMPTMPEVTVLDSGGHGSAM